MCIRDSVRVLTAVDVVGVQVGHVDEQPHPGPLDQLGQELPLGHPLARPGEQRGDVLQRQRHRQRLLRDPHVLAEHVEGVAGARHGQQVARLQAGRRGERAARPDERDVLGDQRSPERLRAFRERREPALVGAVGAAEAEGDAVRDHGHPALAQPQQRVREMARADVLRHDLHPVDARHALHGVRDLRSPADSRTQSPHGPAPPPSNDGGMAPADCAESPPVCLQRNI